MTSCVFCSYYIKVQIEDKRASDDCPIVRGPDTCIADCALPDVDISVASYSSELTDIPYKSFFRTSYLS